MIRNMLGGVVATEQLSPRYQKSFADRVMAFARHVAGDECGKAELDFDAQLRQRLRDEIKSKSKQKAEKWTAFEKVKTEVQEEAKKAGEDPVTYLKKSENFDKVDAVHKEYSTLAQEIDQLTQQLLDASGWEPKGPSEPAPIPGEGETKDGKPGEAKVIRLNLERAAKKFTGSDEYKRLVKQGVLDNWSEGTTVRMDPVQVLERDEFKALVTGASDTSAGAMIFSDRIEGVFVGLPFRPFRIAELVAARTTDSDVIEYVEQTSRTNAAAETAEATTQADGALPESTQAWVVKTVNVQNIGHWEAVTSRALQDEAQLQGIIEGELTEGVRERLDGQLLNGNGTAPNLRGILNTTGIQTRALGTDSRSDAVHKIMTTITIASTVNQRFSPNAVALHPSDMEDVRLEKDANGNYIYGPPSQDGPLRMWGRPVVDTLALTAGTALTGDFTQAVLWLRAGVTTAITDSHSDFFIRNILALKANMRVAFAAVRPGAFGTVSGF